MALTLQQIEARLQIFEQYLQYRIDNWFLLPFGQTYTFNTEGILYSGKIYSFKSMVI
jgi:hypothetical protein